MCLNASFINREMSQFSHFTSDASEAKQRPRVLHDAKFHCDFGLHFLWDEEYKLAALEFVAAGSTLGANYQGNIAPKNIAIYGGVLALASYNRAELKSEIIDDINFSDFLEREVPEIRNLIHNFYYSRFASCADYLGKLEAMLFYDRNFRPYVDPVFDQIRKKALAQYIIPYVSVDLKEMAVTFNTDVAGLEKELKDVIIENQIEARIDSQNKILYARHADKRNETFQSVLQSGREFDRDARAMLLRANLLKQEDTSLERIDMSIELHNPDGYDHFGHYGHWFDM